MVFGDERARQSEYDDEEAPRGICFATRSDNKTEILTCNKYLASCGLGGVGVGVGCGQKDAWPTLLSSLCGYVIDERSFWLLGCLDEERGLGGGRFEWLFLAIFVGTHLINMSIPVVSIARLMPFHEATIVYFCLAVSGNRLSVGGGPQASRLGTLLPLEPPPLLLANFVSSQPMVSTLLLLHLLLLLVCLFFLFVLGCLCLLFFPPFFFCRYNRLVSPRRRRLHFLNP